MISKVQALALAQSGITGLAALAILSGWPTSCHVEVAIENDVPADTVVVIDRDTIIIIDQEEQEELNVPTGGGIRSIANT
jgi:hypothetical protein